MHFSTEQLRLSFISQRGQWLKKDYESLSSSFLIQSVLYIAAKVIVLKSPLTVPYRLSYDGSVFHFNPPL